MILELEGKSKPRRRAPCKKRCIVVLRSGFIPHNLSANPNGGAPMHPSPSQVPFGPAGPSAGRDRSLWTVQPWPARLSAACVTERMVSTRRTSRWDAGIHCVHFRDADAAFEPRTALDRTALLVREYRSQTTSALYHMDAFSCRKCTASMGAKHEAGDRGQFILRLEREKSTIPHGPRGLSQLYERAKVGPMIWARGFKCRICVIALLHISKKTSLNVVHCTDSQKKMFMLVFLRLIYIY
jgi:hypothetical protein